MRGIVSIAGYVPYRRLERSSVTAFFGKGGGAGTRAVAGFDEDTTTMAVEACRLALDACPAGHASVFSPGGAPMAVWLSTASPVYLDKTNATVLHAALGLPEEASAYDFGGALRSAGGVLNAALDGRGTVLVAVADRRDGLPTSVDEQAAGDAAAAVLVADDGPGTPVIAEQVARASLTTELLERWRAPGEPCSSVWEERLAEGWYMGLGQRAWERALAAADTDADGVDRAAVVGMHGRAVAAVRRSLGVRPEALLADDLTATVGQAGSAHGALVLASLLERADPGETIALVSLADGADVTVLRTTAAVATWRPVVPVADQVANGATLDYARFLAWRGMVTPEPPRRPEPARVSSAAAGRSVRWKYGFVGSRDRSSGMVHLPPARVSASGGGVDDMEPAPRADDLATVATFTVDRLAYSPSPPIVFAVVDFDGGGRFPVELTDVDPDEVAIGQRVRMTFRRLFSAEGIHDYFWKATPVRSAPSTAVTRS
jgi:hydroxymethylglutaryl-CoA synthase